MSYLIGAVVMFFYVIGWHLWIKPLPNMFGKPGWLTYAWAISAFLLSPISVPLGMLLLMFVG